MNESLEQPLERVADEIVRVLKEPRVFRWSTWDSWAGRQVHHERGMSEQEAVIAVLTQHSFPSTERDALQRQLAAEREAREKAEAQVRMDTETIERIRAAGEAAEANLALARATIRFLNQSLELAVDALVRYGEHDLNCPVYRDTIGDCDCGWTDTLPKLITAGKDANHDT